MAKLSTRKTSFSQSFANVRGAAGQAIVEGTSILILMVSIAVAVILFVTDLCMTLTYQQKITYLASQGATYYSFQSNGWQYQNTNGNNNIDVNAFVKRLAGQMGIPSERITADVSRNANNDVTVSVKGTNLSLLPGLSFLPGNITLEQSFATNSNILPRPTGLLSITVTGMASGNNAGSNPTVLVPCYSGLAQNDQVGTRAFGDSQDPEIAGPGMYDQFSFSAPYSSGAAMNYTRGSRGMTP